MWAEDQRRNNRTVDVPKRREVRLVGGLGMPDDEVVPANLMYDRRVARGSTHRSFAAALTTYQTRVIEGGTAAAQGPDWGVVGGVGGGAAAPTRRGAQRRKGGGTRKARGGRSSTMAGSGFGAASKLAQTLTHRVHLPLESDGKVHADTPEDRQDALADFLESKLTEPVKHVVQRDFSGMTARFLPKNPPAPFIPAKCGSVDFGTQIEGMDEEAAIFDFDEAGEALFDLIAEKTLETALMEVNEEEELRTIRARWRIADRERLAAISGEQDVQFKIKREMKKKGATRAEAAAAAEVQRKTAHDQTVERMAQAEVAAAALAATKRAEEAMVEAKGGAWLRVFVDRSGGRDPACVGPIPVVPDDTVQAVEERVLEWIAAHAEVESSSIAGDPSLPLRLCASGTPLPRTQTLMDAVSDPATRLQLVRASG